MPIPLPSREIRTQSHNNRSSSTSSPEPIPLPSSREIRTQPHESEPAHSYDNSEPSPLLDEEDDFHNKLSRSRRESFSGGTGGSFWRTSDDRPATPNTSVNLKKTPPASAADAVRQQDNNRSANNKKARSTGLLGAALLQPPNNHNNNDAQHRNVTDTSGASSSISSMRRSEPDRSSTGGSAKDPKKNIKKQRNADRRRKQDVIEEQIESGHIIESRQNSTSVAPPLNGFGDLHIHQGSSLDRSSSDQSTGSLLYGKTPNSGAILGKSSSLIFPTGVETSTEGESEVDSAKRRKINLLLDQCEAIRFPFKKKLTLEKLNITAADIPLNYLCGTSLGNSLHKLSLSGNRLGNVPPKLVQTLPALRHLDLSQCELHQLPSSWNLPQLRKLNLGHNRLRDFPDEVSWTV